MEESRKYILFTLHGQAYAVDAQYVISIERLPSRTSFPKLGSVAFLQRLS